MIMDSIFRNYTRAGKKCMRMKYDTSLDPRIFSHAYGQQRKSIKFVLVFAGAMLTSHFKENKMTHTMSTRDVDVQRLVIFSRGEITNNYSQNKCNIRKNREYL